MKPIRNILMILTATISLWGCQKDPLKDVNEGKWNKERNIVSITFNGQVGKAVITRTGDLATISFTYNTAISDDLSHIAINKMEISYGATSSVVAGEALNFDNASHSDVISVTPANGEPLEWTITLTPFVETILGTWNISGLYVFGGTGPDYGGAAVVKMTDKSWCWSATNGPAAEQDNSLTFTYTGITEDGNTYGTVVNNAGSDGLYANFIYVASDPDVDVNHFYRKIPTGTATWARNYSTNQVTFTFTDGSTSTGGFISAGTETLYGTITRTTVDHAFTFILTGTDDWSHIYSDYDKFVSRPRKYYIDIRKSK